MKLWPIFLGIWIILQGLISMINLNFRYDDMVMAILAIITGTLVIIRK